MNFISSLPDTPTGIYLITTASGSRHLINFDRMTLTRITGRQQPSGAHLRRDGEDIDIISVGRCVIGHRLPLILNLHVPGVEFTLRSTTRIVSIEAVQWDAAALGEPKRSGTPTPRLNRTTSAARASHDHRHGPVSRRQMAAIGRSALTCRQPWRQRCTSG